MTAAMTVIDPEAWEPCSPSYLARGGTCDAPRVWNAATLNHWHPKLTSPTPPQVEGIVGELRKLGGGWVFTDPGPVMRRAANEIERLQELQPDYTREDYNRLHRAYCTEHERAEAAEAKLAEMRKALEAIAFFGDDPLAIMARAALATPPASREAKPEAVEWDKKPIAIWSHEQANLYHAATDEERAAWNAYAEQEAEKLNNSGVLDSYDSTATLYQWAPPLSFSKWRAGRLAAVTAPDPRIAYLEAEVARLRKAAERACDLLAERAHGSIARSPGHNARLELETALNPERKP